MSAAAEGFSLPADIRAAILWDVPALQRSGPAAANFLKAFGPPPWDLDDGASGPLNDAAEAVVAAAYGRTADALGDLPRARICRRTPGAAARAAC